MSLTGMLYFSGSNRVTLTADRAMVGMADRRFCNYQGQKWVYVAGSRDWLQTVARLDGWAAVLGTGRIFSCGRYVACGAVFMVILMVVLACGGGSGNTASGKLSTLVRQAPGRQSVIQCELGAVSESLDRAPDAISRASQVYQVIDSTKDAIEAIESVYGKSLLALTYKEQAEALAILSGVDYCEVVDALVPEAIALLLSGRPGGGPDNGSSQSHPTIAITQTNAQLALPQQPSVGTDSAPLPAPPAPLMSRQQTEHRSAQPQRKSKSQSQAQSRPTQSQQARRQEPPRTTARPMPPPTGPRRPRVTQQPPITSFIFCLFPKLVNCSRAQQPKVCDIPPSNDVDQTTKSLASDQTGGRAAAC